MTNTKPLTLVAANDVGASCDTTLAITGLIGLLARSQARRLAEATEPANLTCAPSSRSAQP